MSKKEKVYVVLTPHGEGTRVAGVYSTEEKAKAAIKGHTKRDKIEARPLDEASE